MPKGCRIFLKIICVLFIFLILSFTILMHMFRMPDKFLTESTSPKGTYTIKIYLINGGATTNYSIRGEVIMNHWFHYRKNIYWEENISKGEICWRDNYTVIINGHEIKLPNGKYDERRDKGFFIELSI